MMTVKELVRNLQNFMLTNPDGGNHEVMLKFDGDVCMEFGRADRAGGMPGENYLILLPMENGKRIGIKDIGIKH